jgi:hypothetical protein
MSHGFKEKTRCRILEDAISFCPQELKTYLDKNVSAVHSGIHFADRHRGLHSSIKPSGTEVVYNALVQELKEDKQNEFNTVHRFGVLACFVAETISPDRYMTSRSLVPENVQYDGFQEVNDIKTKISDLIEKYRKPYRRNMNKDVTDLLYNATVNEIVDHWITAWQVGGNKAGELRERGAKISHKEVLMLFRGRKG